MDFVRWGMQDAQPRFNKGRLMENAVEFFKPRQDHHKTFDLDVCHPDAQFIAAARTALPEALEQLEWHEINQKQLEDQCDSLIDENDSLRKQITSLEKSLRIACEGLKEVQS